MGQGEWRLWEQLIDERGIMIDRPRGEAHPLYPHMIYPYDYGYVPGTAAADGHEVDVFVGRVQAGLVGMIALVHQPSGIADPKLLVNLTVQDAYAIIAFQDQGHPGPDLELLAGEDWRGRAGHVDLAEAVVLTAEGEPGAPFAAAEACFARYELRGDLAETLLAAGRPGAAEEIYRSCGAGQAWLDRLRP